MRRGEQEARAHVARVHREIAALRMQLDGLRGSFVPSAGLENARGTSLETLRAYFLSLNGPMGDAERARLSESLRARGDILPPNVFEYWELRRMIEERDLLQVAVRLFSLLGFHPDDAIKAGGVVEERVGSLFHWVRELAANQGLQAQAIALGFGQDSDYAGGQADLARLAIHETLKLGAVPDPEDPELDAAISKAMEILGATDEPFPNPLDPLRKYFDPV